MFVYTVEEMVGQPIARIFASDLDDKRQEILTRPTSSRWTHTFDLFFSPKMVAGSQLQ